MKLAGKKMVQAGIRYSRGKDAKGVEARVSHIPRKIWLKEDIGVLIIHADK